MPLEVFAAFFLGLLIGIVAGLIPGLHVNNTIPIVLGLSFLFDPMSAAVILISAAVAQVFIGFIPSILLGAPEEGTALSTLPGHRLMLQGRAYEAIKLTVIGGLGAMLLSIFLLILIEPYIKIVYTSIRPHLGYILSIVAAYMVFSEKSKERKFYGAVVLLLSGLLGIISLNGLGNLMLFPMLTGLFGISLLVNSIRSETKIPTSMSFEEQPIPRKDVAGSIAIGSAAGILVGLLPGVGSSQAAVIAQELSGTKSEDADRRFLISIAGVNVSDMIYSLLALWLLSNPRSGVAVAVGSLMHVGLNEVMIFLAVIIAATGISAYLTLKLARIALPLMRRVHYKNLSIAVVVLLWALIGYFTGLEGILVAFVSSVIGMVAILSGVKKSLCMGCLLIPTILFFL